MEHIERGLLKLIAQDRLEIPISSLSGKLKRAKPKTAKTIELTAKDGEFYGERVYARIEESEEMKARGMREGIEAYCEKFPQHGKILNGLIEEKRIQRETHLYFGLQEGKRMSATSYLQVMNELGFSETQAENLYPALIETSNQIAKKRGNPERSILIG